MARQLPRALSLSLSSSPSLADNDSLDVIAYGHLRDITVASLSRRYCTSKQLMLIADYLNLQPRTYEYPVYTQLAPNDSSAPLDTNIDSTLNPHMKKEEVIANLQKKLQDHPEVYQQIALAESDSS